jgi:hypothetical protein
MRVSGSPTSSGKMVRRNKGSKWRLSLRTLPMEGGGVKTHGFRGTGARRIGQPHARKNAQTPRLEAAGKGREL